jgi:hypothetical protein
MTPVDWHPTDDELTLHAYRENTPDERGAIDRHLADCAACAATWQELEALLRLATSADVPEPGPEFEAGVWARLAPALAAYPTPSRGWTLRKAVFVGAWAAAVGGLMVGGHRWLTRTPAPEATVAMTNTDRSGVRQRVLLTALDDHLSQTEMLFVELMNAPDRAPGSMTFERDTADDLLQSGRLYRATAAETGERRLTDVLDDVQTVLTEVAHVPDAPGTDELAAIRARIEHDDLLFKVRAVTNDIRDRQQQPATPNEGAL